MRASVRIAIVAAALRHVSFGLRERELAAVISSSVQTHAVHAAGEHVSDTAPH